jgi:hypothetical protein
MPVVELPVRAETRRRVRNRLPLVIAMWVACVLGVGWVASATTVGPVVAELTTRRGFHAGDLLLAAGVAVVASMVTWLLLRPRRDGDAAIEVVAVELRRIPAILALWFAVMVSSLWAAFETEVGPVLFVYNNHRSVRLGDLAFTIVAVAVASWLTAVLLKPTAERRPR